MFCRHTLPWLAVFSALIIVIGIALEPNLLDAQTASSAPRVNLTDLQYLGAFRVPDGGAVGLPDKQTLRYAQGPLAFNPQSTTNPNVPSLFVACFLNQGATNIAEITIPTPVVSASGNLSSLPTASITQNCQDAENGASGKLSFSQGGIGGILVSGKKLYFTVYNSYPAGPFSGGAHYVKNSLNLSASDASGPFVVTNSAGDENFTNGPMAWIPAEWQSLFGNKPAITYQCCISTITNTSWGPSAFAFDPAALGPVATPSVALQWYSQAHPTLGQWDGGPLNYPPYWNNAIVPGQRGLVLVPDTRSALYFTAQGQTYCYGMGTANKSLDGTPVPGESGVIYCYDPDGVGGKGDHGYPYRFQIMAFDLNDWAAVVAGTKQPHNVLPYAVWPLVPPNTPFTDGVTNSRSGGTAYDPSTRRIYWEQSFADGSLPIIHVWQVNAVGGSATAAPTVAISANPASIISGDSSNLNWSSINATSCTASGSWSGTKATSGTQSTGSLTSNANYSLTCTGTGGSATQSVTVTVMSAAAPTVTISASPTSVTSGSAATLSWNTANATSCTASGAWSGTKSTSGTQSTGTLSATSTYTLNCTGAGGSASQSAIVTVTAASTPQPSNPINVSGMAGLQSAIGGLTSNTTILLADGTYNLTSTLYLPQNISNVIIKGASGNRDAVVIKGPGMSNSSVPFGFWMDNMSGVTFQDMTIRDFNQHAIIANGGVDSPVYRNLHIIDIGDQFLKNNPTSDQLNGIDNGLVENCLLEYSSAAPDAYTNGLDVHRGKNWIVRGNTFKNFWNSGGLAGPAVLIWNGSSDSTVTGNTFINNQRDISLGLDPTKPVDGITDHARGVIANNFIYKTSSIAPDVPIAIFDSPQTKVYYNTVLVNGGYPNAIEYRFPRTTGVDIKNNLTDAAVAARDGASGSVGNNVTNATTGMFVSASTADLHLVSSATAAIDKGVAVSVTNDFDGQARPQGVVSDIGADEYVSSLTPPAAPGNLVVQ